MQADFSPMLASPASARQYAETQFEIIKRYVLAFQAALDEDHDVGVLLSSFGTNVLMEVDSIWFHRPVLMVFKGRVNERPTILIQHISQINFLLQVVPKDPAKPHRTIGFNADWPGKQSTPQTL